MAGLKKITKKSHQSRLVIKLIILFVPCVYIICVRIKHTSDLSSYLVYTTQTVDRSAYPPPQQKKDTILSHHHQTSSKNKTLQDLNYTDNDEYNYYNNNINMIESYRTLPRYIIESRQRAKMLGRYTGPFDLVYLWANNTQKWSEGKNKVLRKMNMTTGNWSPTRDNNELKLSMRSVEKYLPWIRNIIIMSSGQIPEWLDTDHPRIRIINSDDLIDQIGGASPNYNSHALYLASAFIPNISEIYIQMDDDFIIGQPLPESFFYWNYQHEITSINSWGERKDLKNQFNLLSKILPKYNPKWATHMPVRKTLAIVYHSIYLYY